MGYPAKTMALSAFLAKLEATYGTAVAPAATADGQLLALSDRYPHLAELTYYNDGRLGPAPGNLGDLRRVAPTGRAVRCPIPMRAKGAGTTYAATVVPNLHVMLQLSGHDATLAAGAYTYTPTAGDVAAYKSATTEYYKRGEKWSAIGVLANWKFSMDGPLCPLHTFDTMGICSADIADATVVAPTYPNLSVQEPVAQGCTFTMGSFSAAVLRGTEWDMGREIENPRWDLQAATGHRGFVPGGYAPKLTVVIEATALVATPFLSAAGLDPYKLREAANSFGVGLKVGSGTYNNWELQLPQVQLADVRLANEGPLATVELDLVPYHSSPVLQTDAWRVVFGA